MTPQQIFSIANLVALCCWLLLVVLPGRKWVTRTVTGLAVPVAFAALYIVLIAMYFPGAEGGFSSLSDVAALFANPVAAARRLDPLPCIRSAGRNLGSERRTRPRHPSSGPGAVPVPDVHVWSGGLVDLSRRALSHRTSATAARDKLKWFNSWPASYCRTLAVVFQPRPRRPVPELAVDPPQELVVSAVWLILA